MDPEVPVAAKAVTVNGADPDKVKWRVHRGDAG